MTLPRAWLSGVLQEAISDVVDLGDEWEYRRLVELLKDLNVPLFDSYIDDMGWPPAVARSMMLPRT